MKENRIKLSVRISLWVRRMMQSKASEQLAVLLLTAGATLACSPWLGLESNLLITLGVSFVSVFLVWLFTRRVWVLPATVGAAALGFGVVALLRLISIVDDFFTDLMSRVVWFWQTTPSVYCVLVALPLALIFFFTVRRLLSLSVLGVLCTAIVVIEVLQKAEHKTAVLALFIAGYLILLPAAQYRRMNKTMGGHSVSLSALQLTAIPVAAVSLIAALFIVPADTNTWKSEALLNFVYDCNDVISYYFGRSQARNDSFKISGLGYQPLSDRLGGPINPGDRQLLTIHTESGPFLLRGAVEDTYTGVGWRDGWRNGRFRFDSLVWRVNRNQIFLPDLPLWKKTDYSALRDELVSTVEANVAYDNGWTRGIFVSGRLTRLTPPKDMETYFNLQSELFTSHVVGRAKNYDFTADIFSTTSSDFDENMLLLEQQLTGYRDGQWENICRQYLQLPEELPDVVTDTAREITEGTVTPYQKAAAIEKWLAQNCTYTLTPDVPPKGEDFVAHFLQTREGYCTYYGSAMTVLARCAGLPARYITGFAMQQSQAPGVYYVTEKAAHAWAELYFSGIGWVPFDPLSFDEGLEESGGSAGEGLAEGAAPYANQPERPQGTPQGPLNAQAAEDEYNGLLAGLLTLLLLLAAAYICYRCLMRLPLHAYRYEQMARRIEGADRQLDYYFEDILKQMEIFGLSLYLGETLLEFAPRCDRRLAIDAKNGMARLSQTYMRLKYGLIPPNRDEIKETALYHESLERRVRQKLGKAAYFFKRVLPVCRAVVSMRRDK